MHDGNVIASRHLTFTPKDGGVPRKVHVLLGKPHSPIHRDNEWVVDIEIQESFKQAIHGTASGADSFQALYLAMIKAGEMIKPWSDAGELTWDGPNLGFPAPI
ncbi:DUF6968 family protein [Sorangium sp. So ce1389]|uniref:DUF6968 family protein n=1 Tax=Sorangium sp. So ce1389 TaxID=3133336 RepID=UPI003F61EE1A